MEILISSRPEKERGVRVIKCLVGYLLSRQNFSSGMRGSPPLSFTETSSVPAPNTSIPPPHQFLFLSMQSYIFFTRTKKLPLTRRLRKFLSYDKRSFIFSSDSMKRRNPTLFNDAALISFPFFFCFRINS